MSSFRSVGRALESTLAIILVGGVLVSGASGALTIHLRPAGATENGVVTGQDGNAAP